MKDPAKGLGTFLLLLLVGMSAMPGARGASDAWTSSGPQGASIWALIAGDKALFAASDRGIHKSTDGGHRWDLVAAASPEGPLGGGSVTGLAIDPADPSVVFATVSSPIGKPLLKSNDAGKSWKAITAGLTFPFDGSWQNYSIRSLAFDPIDSRVMYAATGRDEAGVAWAVIVKSLDGGESWQRVSTLYTGCVTGLKIDPDNRDTLYAVTSACGSHASSHLVKSTDGGTSWSAIENGLPHLPSWPPWPSQYPPELLKSIIIDLRKSSTLYVATTEDGVYRSRDAGATWQPVNEGLPRRRDSVTRYPNVEALTQGHDGALYAGLNPYGLFKSTDGGDHWGPLNFGSKVTGISFGITARSLLYVVSARGIYRSADGGDSWNEASHGIINTGIWSVTTDPTMHGVVYAGTFLVDSAGYDDGKAGDGRWTPLDPPAPGAFRSGDRGRTWSRTSLPTGGQYSFAIDARTGTIYATNTYALFKSVDHGATWRDLDAPFHNHRALAIDTERSILYVGTIYDGVQKTADGGGSWSAANNGLTAGEWRPVSWLAIDPSDPNVIFAATYDQGVFKTIDGGGVWTRLRQGLTYRAACDACPAPEWEWNFRIGRIAIDPSSPQVIYAGADPVTNPNNGAALVEGGVLKSEDGGMTWRWVDDGLQSPDSRIVLDLAVDPRNHQVYASTYAGIYRSQGEEMSWLRMWDQPALSLALDVHPPGAIHAGTWAGVFTLDPLPGTNPAASKGAAKE